MPFDVRYGVKPRGIIFSAQFNEEYFSGNIEDSALVERIIYYWDHFYDKHPTNCSSFAHYLMTGEFLACEPEKRSIVIEHGMRPLSMASKIDIGDMLCLLYVEDSSKKRSNALAKYYRKSKKAANAETGFYSIMEWDLRKEVFTPSIIRASVLSPTISDYHFLTCVGKLDGEPIWLAQEGFVKPGSGTFCFSITRGSNDSYIDATPMVALIKKRR